MRSFRSTLVLIILLSASLPVMVFSSLLVKKIDTVTRSAALRELELRVQSVADSLNHEIDLFRVRLLTLAANRDMALATKKTALGVRHFLSYRAMDAVREFIADNPLVSSMYLIDIDMQVVDAAPASVVSFPPTPVMADVQAMLAKEYGETTARHVFVEFHDRDFIDQTFTLLSKAERTPLHRPVKSGSGLAIMTPLILDVANEVKGALVGIVPFEHMATHAFARLRSPTMLTFLNPMGTILAQSHVDESMLAADHITRATPFVVQNSEHGLPIAYVMRLSEPSQVWFAEVQSTLIRLVLSILGAVMVLVIFAYVIARWLLSPLRKLERVVLAYAEGHYDVAPSRMPFLEFQQFVALLHGMGRQILAQVTALQHSQEQLEAANRTLEHRVDERTRELTRSVEELQALGEVSRAVSSTLDLQTVLTTIVSRAAQLSGTYGGAIYEYNEVAQAFELRATHGVEAKLVHAIQAAPILLGEGAVGRAGVTRIPVQVPDLLAERQPVLPRVRTMLAQAGYRSLLAIPLLIEQRIMGGLVVVRRELGRFPEDIVNLLQTFATQSTLAIQNAQLFREIEERGYELEIASKHKSQFLANMSHELRTPLNGVLGYGQILQRDPTLTTAQRDIVGAISQCGQHLLTLINDVLDLSKIESQTLEIDSVPCDLPSLLQSVYDMVSPRAEEKGVHMRMEVSPDVPRGIRTDGTKLRQVLVNLLGNAVKFTDHGTVTLQVAESPASHLVMAVQDTGIGITPEQLHVIFDPFQQVQSAPERGGTGLGLAISRRLVEALGGTLEVESHPGKGSCFTLTLPLIEVDVSDATLWLEASLSDTRALVLEPGQDITVLIADDRSTNRDMLVRLLHSAGFSTLEARDGLEVLATLRAHHPPLVLMDMRMPGMNGLEATRAIREDAELRDTIVIAVTASVFPDFYQRILDVGCDDFIAKPFRASEIFSKIGRHLHVEFVDQRTASPVDEAADIAVSLPPVLVQDIARRVRDAIEVGDVAAIMTIATELTAGSETAVGYGKELNRLASAFDFEAVLRLVDALEQAALHREE